MPTSTHEVKAHFTFHTDSGAHKITAELIVTLWQYAGSWFEPPEREVTAQLDCFDSGKLKPNKAQFDAIEHHCITALEQEFSTYRDTYRLDDLELSPSIPFNFEVAA